MLTATVPSSSSTTMCPAAHAMPRSAFFGGQLQRQLFLATGRAPPPTVRRSFPAVEAKVATRRENRIFRHQRIRKKVEGTSDRPRMCVFRSNKHLYVQVIDDSKMHTLASASTMQKPISEEFDYSCGPTIEVARKIGEVIAKSCLEKGVTRVVFDRGGHAYHGRIAALATAARENGLEF